jgi:hypothetical protein
LNNQILAGACSGGKFAISRAEGGYRVGVGVPHRNCRPMVLYHEFICCFVLVISLASPVFAQWQRAVSSGKGTFTDVPAPHPLRYFTANPYLRDDGDDLCARCAPGRRPGAEREYVISSEVQRLGTLAGFPIVQILYRVGPRAEGKPANVRWKSLLVQVGEDLYREIYHLQAYYIVPPLESAEIIKVGGEEVLATDDSVGGNGGGCWEEYWWFDSSGPHELDFSQVRTSIIEHIPSGANFQMSCWALHLGGEFIKSYVQKANPHCMACDMLGEVTADFQLHGALAVPTKVTYTVNAP